MIRKHLFAFFVSIIFFSLLPGKSYGLMLKYELSELSQKADAITMGKVESIYSYWDANKTLIFTDVRISIEKTIKGKSSGEIIVTQLGGSVGDMTLTVSDMPVFSERESVILFLVNQDNREGSVDNVPLNDEKIKRREEEKRILSQQLSASSGIRVLGNIQGKYQVVENPLTQELEVITPNFSYLSDDMKTQVSSSGKIPLDEFLLEVEKSIR